MTYREKLQIDYPDAINKHYTGGCRGCPYDYNYCAFNCPANFGSIDEETCAACWNREMPEEKKAEEPVELNINLEEEKKMRNLSDIIRDAVLNAINDSDIEYAVKECFESHDYSDMIERAVENYLYENIEDIADDIVEEAVRDYMRENL